MSGYVGESEYYKQMRLAGVKRFDEAQRKADFERRYRPKIEAGMSEDEFVKGERKFGDTLEDFQELKAEMEEERRLDEAFLKGFQSVRGPYQRYNQVAEVQEDTAGDVD